MIGKDNPYTLGYKAGYKKAIEDMKEKGDYKNGYLDAISYMQSLVNVAKAKAERGVKK